MCHIGELWLRAGVTCSVTNLTKVSIIIYYCVNRKVKISRIPTYGCEIRVIRASRVLDPVLRVSKNKIED